MESQEANVISPHPLQQYNPKLPGMTTQTEDLGAGDSHIVNDVLPPELARDAFERLRREVRWQKMFHRGGEVPRLVAVEGEVGEDGSFPIYRHPADSSPPLFPFSPTVKQVRDHVQKRLDHPLNHVLIQCYRNGADYISEHSDKTIDVVGGSCIVNVSFGAQRVMVLRGKKDASRAPDPGSTDNSAAGLQHQQQDEADHLRDKQLEKGHGPPRPVQRFPLPHNSMFIMGLKTNRQFLHSIPHDKRPLAHKAPAEQAYDGERISLTFRYIGTWLSQDGSVIWGQGARGKDRANARPVLSGEEALREGEGLLEAFGRENHESGFVWEDWYGEGFDVVNFVFEGEGKM